jgi:hypothetical protein
MPELLTCIIINASLTYTVSCDLIIDVTNQDNSKNETISIFIVKKHTSKERERERERLVKLLITVYVYFVITITKVNMTYT